MSIFPLNNINPSILVKLGYIARHCEEGLSSNGHPSDFYSCKSLLNDPEVKSWMEEMDKLALLPVKR